MCGGVFIGKGEGRLPDDGVVCWLYAVKTGDGVEKEEGEWAMQRYGLGTTMSAGEVGDKRRAKKAETMGEDECWQHFLASGRQDRDGVCAHKEQRRRRRQAAAAAGRAGQRGL